MGIFNVFQKKQSAKQDHPSAKEEKKPSRESSAVSASSSEKRKKQQKKGSGAYTRILLRPLVTEKAASFTAQGKYFFVVARHANKIQVAKAVQDIYGVHPISVRILPVSGKQVRYGRTVGRTNDWKKAIVTLQKGETIQIYEGV